MNKCLCQWEVSLCRITNVFGDAAFMRRYSWSSEGLSWFEIEFLLLHLV